MFALRVIGVPIPEDGFAALRFWGQTGERSGAWMAAADPVHLEARLNSLRVHAFHGDELSRTDLRELFDHLQDILGEDNRFSLARLGPFIYLRGDVPVATASVSTDVVDGRAPDDFMPSGDSTATHDLITSELQLSLHDHELNRRRTAAGMRTVNSIWFWGGGRAREPEVRPVPTLVADDPLFRGYWLSCSGDIKSWTDDFEKVLDLAPGGFVAVVPRDNDESRHFDLGDCLERLRRIVKGGAISKLTLLFRDGLEIDIARSDAFRFWRRVSPLLED